MRKSKLSAAANHRFIELCLLCSRFYSNSWFTGTCILDCIHGKGGKTVARNLQDGGGYDSAVSQKL